MDASETTKNTAFGANFPLHWFLLALTAIMFLLSVGRYFVLTDYYILVEAPCDPQTQSCYIRDCDDYCPPNELAIYREFSIPAGMFKQCTDNSCLNVCLSEEGVCGENICSDQDEIECEGPYASNATLP